jgi:hypothetical protein
MSAANGGRGEPPIPPEGHGPPQEVPISKEIIQPSQATSCQRTANGARLSFVVIENGEVVQHTYSIGEPGKKLILEELSGGLTLP